MLGDDHAMTVKGSSDEVVFGEAWRSSRPAERVEQVPDHIEISDDWPDFIGVFQRAFASYRSQGRLSISSAMQFTCK
jgi:hypothetical protein